MELKEWKGSVVEVVSPTDQILRNFFAFVENQGYSIDPVVKDGVGITQRTGSDSKGYSWFIPITK